MPREIQNGCKTNTYMLNIDMHCSAYESTQIRDVNLIKVEMEDGRTDTYTTWESNIATRSHSRQR